MSWSYVGIQTADKHVKYEHREPFGAALVVYCILSAFLLTFIQNAFFSKGGPNLLMVFVFLAAMKAGQALTLSFAAISGLAVDLIFGRYLGFYGLLFFIVALAALAVKRWCDTKPRAVLFSVPVFFAFEIAENALSGLLGILFGGKMFFDLKFFSLVLPGFAFDVAAAAVMIIPVYALWRRLTPH